MYHQGAAIDLQEQRRILEAALGAAAEARRRGVVVFDLDSTLLDNRPRQALIVREYGAASGLEPLQRCGPEHFTSWSLADAMRAVGLPAAEVEQHQRSAKDFWRERFFTSQYCALDLPVAGAVDFTAAVKATGVQIAYVTGRHLPMGPGTVACFQREHFPLPDGERVHLLLKPQFETTDDAWKFEAYARLDALGDVVAAFDNEPAHVNGYAARYLAALCVRLATDDSGRPIPVAPGVPSVANFLR